MYLPTNKPTSDKKMILSVILFAALLYQLYANASYQGNPADDRVLDRFLSK